MYFAPRGRSPRRSPGLPEVTRTRIQGQSRLTMRASSTPSIRRRRMSANSSATDRALALRKARAASALSSSTTSRSVSAIRVAARLRTSGSSSTTSAMRAGLWSGLAMTVSSGQWGLRLRVPSLSMMVARCSGIGSGRSSACFAAPRLFVDRPLTAGARQGRGWSRQSEADRTMNACPSSSGTGSSDNPQPLRQLPPTGYNVAEYVGVRPAAEIFRGHGALVGVPMLGLAARRDAAHGVLDRHRAGLLEQKRAFERLALLQRLRQVYEHDMVAAGLELDGCAGLDLEPGLERAHAHDLALHRHLVDRKARRRGQRAADEPVGLGAGIGDAHVAAGDLRSAGRGPRPRRLDDERADPVGRTGGGSRSRNLEGRSRRLERVRILPVRRDLDPALGAVLAFLDDREGERLAGRLRGDPGAEDEFVVEGVGQLAAAPDDLLDAVGDRLAVQVVALGVGAASRRQRPAGLRHRAYIDDSFGNLDAHGPGRLALAAVRHAQDTFVGRVRRGLRGLQRRVGEGGA